MVDPANRFHGDLFYLGFGTEVQLNDGIHTKLINHPDFVLRDEDHPASQRFNRVFLKVALCFEPIQMSWDINHYFICSARFDTKLLCVYCHVDEVVEFR